MSLFHHLPIKRKVTLVILLSSLATLLLAAGALFVFQVRHTRQTIALDLDTQCKIVAANSTAALMFNDSKAATEILNSLQVNPHVLCACLYLPDRKLFAHAGAEEDRDELPAGSSLPAGFRFEGRHLLLFQPVRMNNKPIGLLYLRLDFKAKQMEVIKPYLLILGSVLLASSLLALLLSYRLQRIISLPLLGLAGAARIVAEQKDYGVRAGRVGGGEFGLLADTFNHMLSRIQADDAALRKANDELTNEVAERKRAQGQLEDLHRQMMEISRKAGMAEIATNVIHNVGNVLNSVNVSANVVVSRIRGSRVAMLTKVAALLKEHESDLGAFLAHDSQGRKLPGYLALLARSLVDEQTVCLEELDSLSTSIDHIKGIVAMQQNYAKIGGVVEIVSADELVNDALRLNEAALNRDGIQIERRFAAGPTFPVEKHKVLQILINLIRNARYALEEHAGKGRKLTVLTEYDPSGRVRIAVQDNGVGIAPENLNRIFAHGFTTRPKNGHGFGLHSGAIAAKEMGGSLKAHSDGPGRGATFVLDLPLSPAKQAN